MKLKAVILVFCLLALTFSAFGQETIQSSPRENTAKENNFKVNREVFDIAKYPALTAVGRINFIGQQWCTIVLVSEDVAVTAGHCFLKANFKFNLKRISNRSGHPLILSRTEGTESKTSASGAFCRRR
jgi:V8-like Glu-specific endopeptidase